MNTQGILDHTKEINILSSMLNTGMIPHAMLFTGMQGIGKYLIARRFISALFCGETPSPCMACPVCLQIRNRSFPDFIELGPNEKGKIPIGDPEKRENGSIRWLIDRLSKKPVTGTYGVIINGADTISAEAQNALLKSIEEPQKGTHIILISSNKSRLLPTILSRCGEISFKPLAQRHVQDILSGAGVKHEHLEIISEISGGSIELAGLLATGDYYDKILDLCRDISGYFNDTTVPELDINSLQKGLGIDHTLTIVTGLYRKMLLESIADNGKSIFPHDIIVNDAKKLKKFIKILLALRKGLSHNLNFKNSLKGMLYSIDSLDDSGTLDLKYILQG